MSIGIGGSARMVMQDADTIIYEYYAYDLNEDVYRNPEHEFDGIISIDKHALIEPEIHEKIKKQPNGKKKLITKRIRRDVDYISRISLGQIRVENSKFCWKILDNGVGLIAMRLIHQIFDLYQDEGKIPQIIGSHV